jgi:hypothetical protein
MLFRNSDGSSAARIQAKSQKLARDPAPFFDLAEPVLFIENAKSVRFHAAQQSVIDRRHDLRGDHRATVFSRKQGRGPREEFFRARSLEFHQPDEGVVVAAGAEIGFGIAEPGEIFVR